jgi:hypothetical protein
MGVQKASFHCCAQGICVGVRDTRFASGQVGCDIAPGGGAIPARRLWYCKPAPAASGSPTASSRSYRLKFRRPRKEAETSTDIGCLEPPSASRNACRSRTGTASAAADRTCRLALVRSTPGTDAPIRNTSSAQRSSSTRGPDPACRNHTSRCPWCSTVPSPLASISSARIDSMPRTARATKRAPVTRRERHLDAEKVRRGHAPAHERSSTFSHVATRSDRSALRITGEGASAPASGHVSFGRRNSRATTYRPRRPSHTRIEPESTEAGHVSASRTRRRPETYRPAPAAWSLFGQGKTSGSEFASHRWLSSRSVSVARSRSVSR